MDDHPNSSINLVVQRETSVYRFMFYVSFLHCLAMPSTVYQRKLRESEKFCDIAP